MRKHTVLTSFNQGDLHAYAQKFIDCFDKNMPNEVDLFIYAKNCDPKIPKTARRKITVIHVEKSLSKLMRFKKIYTYDRRSLDIEYVEQLVNRKYWMKQSSNFKRYFHHIASLINKIKKNLMSNKIVITKKNRHLWNFITDSHKAYCIVDASRKVKSDTMIWVDSNAIIHTKIPIEILNELTEDNIFMSYLGQKDRSSDYCSYVMNLNHKHATSFFNELERMYEQAEDGLFKLEKWTYDCVLDHVRSWHEKTFNIHNQYINENNSSTGHLFLNSILTKYIRHQRRGPQQITIESKRSKVVFFLPCLDLPFKMAKDPRLPPSIERKNPPQRKRSI